MNDTTKTALLIFSLALLFLSGVLFFISKSQFDQTVGQIPEGSSIGSYPVGGADIASVLDAVQAIYESPIELTYLGSRIQLQPKDLGFGLNREETLNRFNNALAEASAGNTLLAYLFGQSHSEPVHSELIFTEDTDAVRSLLTDEIAPRYDRPAQAKQPAEDGTRFLPGHSGTALDAEAAVPLILEALRSDTDRSVELPVEEIPEPKAALVNLEIILRNVIDTWQDEGQVTEVYFSDPQTNEWFDIARRDRSDLIPEISFTAASTMKLPIMISSYARMDEEPTPITQKMLRLMITESKNDQTDWMMENIIGGEYAPLTVTEDMHLLGMKNSFLSGYFYLGAPLLALVETEANTRTDVSLKPDVYNQTTPRDMGTLMDALYRCEANGDGLLFDVLPDQITQHECEEMIQLLKDNHLPYLISAGVPDTVEVAHKHGWIEETDGLLHTMSNIGAVYSPGGDYILSIYTYHPENLIFDEGNTLFSQISAAVYDYFNPTAAEED